LPQVALAEPAHTRDVEGDRADDAPLMICCQNGLMPMKVRP
jgi:hypothetical protein